MLKSEHSKKYNSPMSPNIIRCICKNNKSTIKSTYRINTEGR